MKEEVGNENSKTKRTGLFYLLYRNERRVKQGST